MRQASEAERRRLSETFAALRARRTSDGRVDAPAALTAAAVAHEAIDDGSGLLARLGRQEDGGVLLCVDLAAAGADAALAALVALAQRIAVEGSPVAVELLVLGVEAPVGARGLDRERLRSTFGYVLDDRPLGQIVVAAPACYRLEATFAGVGAPDRGGSPIVAAARAIAGMRLGRIDEGTVASVRAIDGVAPAAATGHVRVRAEARGLDGDRAEAVVAELVDVVHDAANDPGCACDVDVVVERVCEGYEHRPKATGVVVAEEALHARGYEPARVVADDLSAANALMEKGFPCTALGAGVAAADEVAPEVLGELLDLLLALLDATAAA